MNLAEEDEELHAQSEGTKRGRHKKEKSEKWSTKETEKFYHALQIFGTDFSVIAKLLPGRTRKQIKNKFNKEERENPEKIDLILKQAGTFTLEDFQKLYGPIDNLVKGAGDTDKYLKEKIVAHLDTAASPAKSPKLKQTIAQAEPTAVPETVIPEGKKEEPKKGKINLFGSTLTT